MEEFNRYIFLHYNLQMTESLTISRLALNIFIKNHLKEKNIPLIVNKTVFLDIQKAYYGGNY